MLQVVPPTIFFTVRLRQGAYSDEDISQRHQRNELYIFGFLTVVVGIAVLAVLDAPRIFIALLASAALINVLCWLVNLFWKISVHSASMGSCATLSTIFAPPFGAFMWLCAIVLSWARVRTRNHSPLQVVAGMALASLCVWGTLKIFGLIGEIEQRHSVLCP
ncbi:phosphatase PAP2 family protein [Candidatus Gracilibacteria bacterium]|nr:phosphatase PAP2 family protein [Candidatus Gracilibacteria bacterium]